MRSGQPVPLSFTSDQQTLQYAERGDPKLIVLIEQRVVRWNSWADVENFHLSLPFFASNHLCEQAFSCLHVSPVCIDSAPCHADIKKSLSMNADCCC